MAYFELIFPSLNSPRENVFTYEGPDSTNIGDLVEANLRRRNYRAIVIKKVGKPKFNTKKFKLIKENFLSPWQIELSKYIEDYYFSSDIKAINLFLTKKIFNAKDLDLDCKLKPNSFTEHMEHCERAKQKLNENQKQIVDEIVKPNSDIHLIHGVTGSGKTEVYLHLADHYAKLGKQVLLLVPEIALTPQTSAYFVKHFGKDNVAVFHSKLNDTEKFHEWLRVHRKQAQVVIGSRSSMFLPFQDIGLVIIDEEHDYAYKQDSMPRYHARTIAQWLNHKHKIPLVLGSATPALETYVAAQKGIIKMHKLTERAKKVPLPKIQIVDRKDEIKKRNYNELSDLLTEEITSHLKENEQVVILHNKRGYAHFLQCHDCGEVLKCPRCSISLTLHKSSYNPHLECHYCNYKSDNASTCPTCRSSDLKEVGSGIQRIVKELEMTYPDARILRADSDTTSKKHGFQEIYNKFKNHEADILIGTQMIAKGMDIPNVQLVGVINADIGLHVPDFRAAETSFQLLTQVAGRAGRSARQGHVVIQTYNPDHSVLEAVQNNNAEEFYKEEIELREEFEYPPFSKLLKLTYAHKDKKTVEKNVSKIESLLDQMKIEHKSAPALIEKKYNKYYHNILINTLNPKGIVDQLKLDMDWKIDRDPVSTI
jgi:primosomal protein N' (replication factor Y)